MEALTRQSRIVRRRLGMGRGADPDFEPQRLRDNDPLLIGLLGTSLDRRRRNEIVDELLVGYGVPLVDQLIESWVERLGLPRADASDVRSDVIVRLVTRLHRLAEDPSSGAISNLHDYVDFTVHNAIVQHLRRSHPLHSRLRTRVRYILTHTLGLALWDSDSTLCGLAAWSTRRDAVPVSPPMGVIASASEDARELRRTITDMLKRSGGPVTFDALVLELATALPLADEPFVPTTAAPECTDAPNPIACLENRQYLELLWREIVQLPVRQRRALLLQLRLENGESVAHLLPVFGIADAETLAAVLEMPLEELLDLWNDLPLPDQRIATMLDITRQQVINLRKSARERLARRMGRSRPS